MNGNDLAAVFIANRAGNNQGIKRIIYVMKISDAMKFCSSPKTKSHNFLFCWTILNNIVEEKTGKVNPKSFKKDNGAYNELLTELDIELIDIEELKEKVFENLDEQLSEERQIEHMRDSGVF